MLAQRARREGGTRDETLALIEEAARGALGETRALVAAGAALTGAAPGPDGGPTPELDLPSALARLADRFEREARTLLPSTHHKSQSMYPCLSRRMRSALSTLSNVPSLRQRLKRSYTLDHLP